MEMPQPPKARKGRGALTNESGRFESERRFSFDDGFCESEEEERAVATILSADLSRSVIARNESPDIGFDHSINPYRGCEHGCIYCYARPNHAYLGLSAGLDFETRIFYKPKAAQLLAAELSRKSYRCRPLALGSATDPYQPVERRLRLTRAILEVCRDHRQPVTIVTKSALIERDRDILEAMAAEGLAAVTISVTTLDSALVRVMEPRAANPRRRLQTIKYLAAARIPSAVLAAPMIPALNDAELEAILEQARRAGAIAAGYTLLRLPLELKALFGEWLETHFPAKKKRVLSLLADCHGGTLYDSAWSRRMTGKGPYAEMLAARFASAAKRLGLLPRPSVPLDASRFSPPPSLGGQLRLF